MGTVFRSDASYLSEAQARSRVGGYFYLSDKTDMINGAVHVVANIIRNVMSSAAEAEVAALYQNAKEGAILSKNNSTGNGTPTTSYTYANG